MQVTFEDGKKEFVVIDSTGRAMNVATKVTFNIIILNNDNNRYFKYIKHVYDT